MTATLPPLEHPQETLRETVARLSSAQKNSKGAPAYSRYINRKLGRLFAALAFHLGMTPNQVTAVSAAFSFSAIAVLCIVSPSAFVGTVVALLLVLGYAFDAADGQLARLRGGGSVSGEWLDHMIDCAKISSLHLAVLISLYRHFDLSHDGLLLIPMGFSVVAAVSFFGQILNEQLRRVVTNGAPKQSPSSSALRSLAAIPTDYGVLCVAFLLLGWHTGFFVVYTALFAGSAGYLALAALKWFSDMKGLDVQRVASNA